jgi:ribonuclease G
VTDQEEAPRASSQEAAQQGHDVEKAAAQSDAPATPATETEHSETAAPATSGETPVAPADQPEPDAEAERATEPGAWSALHARRVRATRRPARRGRRATAPPAAAETGTEPTAAVEAATPPATAEPVVAPPVVAPPAVAPPIVAPPAVAPPVVAPPAVAEAIAEPSAPVAPIVAPPAAAQTVAEPPADDERDVIVDNAAPDEALLERSAAVVSDEAMAAAAADEEVTPTRRRRRGRRGRGGGAAAAAAAEAQAADVSPAAEASPTPVPVALEVPQAVEAPPALGVPTAEAPLAPALAVPELEAPLAAEPAPPVSAATQEPTQSAAESTLGSSDQATIEIAPAFEQDGQGDGRAVDDSDEEGEPAEGAQDESGEEGPKRRHRGHRGGRRHRRKTGEAAADETTGEDTPDTDAPAPLAEPAEAATAEPAATVTPAAQRTAPQSDATQVAHEGDEAVAASDEATAITDEPAPARRSRRRGRRRGGDAATATTDGADGAPAAVIDGAVPAAAATVEVDTKVTEEPTDTAADTAAEPAEGVGRRRGGRLRKPAKDSGVTADLPAYKEILVSEDAGEMRVALVEDGRLAEIYIERPGKRSYAGNIYRGKVDNVLPGMDAAFVDIGLERNGFLYVDDIADPEDSEKRPHKITQMIKPGQELLVQVSKDPMGSKGARLTGQLSLAGRYLVYVPGGSGVGVSRRLPSDERDRLRELCKSLKAKNAGLIVRTVAEGKSVEEMKIDLRFLSRLWTRLKTKAEKVKAPGLVYAEADVSLQVARDLYNESFAAVVVDDAKRRKELVAYLEKVAPELATRIELYEGDESLFKAKGIEEQIARALERRVMLPSGGNLVIDHTEALTVIDVNTGRFTGGKGLEDTITRNNLEAAREVVRQLRLRDIGGIIIIDFIDMEFARNREAVLAKLQAELETDRTKTYVVEISPLGLVEMTRQNITDGARGILTQTCPTCEGKARVLSAETMAITIERKLSEHAAVTQAKALLVEVNTSVAERLVAGGRIKRLEKGTDKRFFLEGSKLLPIDTYRIVAEGSREAVESHRIPVHEDQEVTVELEYALTYSPGDAVAHVDGFQLIVLNGRRALGEKRKVRITSLTRAGAMGVILS